jgi:hypothetical protein
MALSRPRAGFDSPEGKTFSAPQLGFEIIVGCSPYATITLDFLYRLGDFSGGGRQEAQGKKKSGDCIVGNMITSFEHSQRALSRSGKYWPRGK